MQYLFIVFTIMSSYADGNWVLLVDFLSKEFPHKVRKQAASLNELRINENMT